MTIRNMVESINTVFPNLGEVYIVHEINNAIKHFALKTNGVIGLYKLGNTDEYVAWRLPENVLRVKSVDVFDSNGRRIYLSDYNINWQVMDGYLVFYNVYGNKLDRLPDSFYDVYFWADIVPEETVIDGEIQLDEKYHEAIESKVLAKLYSVYPVEIATNAGVVKTRDWSAVRYHDAKFNELAREYIKQKNSGKEEGYSIAVYDYAGELTPIKPDKTNVYDNAIIIPGEEGTTGLRWEDLDRAWETI